MDHLLLLLLLWSSGLRAEADEDSGESVRLTGGSGRCSGTLEVKLAGWEPVYHSGWTLKDAVVACRQLDCGTAVSLEWKDENSNRSLVEIKPDCIWSGSALRDCARQTHARHYVLGLSCSDSVRLLDGTGLCSGRLEVRSDQSNQSWSSVCDADFDQQDAEVVCRELGCGPPSVLQGALYGEPDAPTWTEEFQCGGHESALLDCRRSELERNICPSGKAVRLACSEPVRLVGGTSRCAGTLQLKHEGEWRQVFHWIHLEDFWKLQRAAAVCRDLKCGAPLSVANRTEPSDDFVWMIGFECSALGFGLRGCAESTYSSSVLDLTCSEPVRLVGGSSRCEGTLEVNHEEDWRPVSDADSGWTLSEAADACRELDCGSAVSVGRKDESSDGPVWTIRSDCARSGSALKDCVESTSSSSVLHLICSDLLVLPNISVSSSIDGVSQARQQGFQVSKGSAFNVSCSIHPRYPGGSFQLTFTSSNTARNYTQPTANRSAHFLFPPADSAHQGSYSCVYHVHDFSHNISFASRAVALRVSDPTVLIVVLVVLFVILLLLAVALFLYWKGHKRGRVTPRSKSWQVCGLYLARRGQKACGQQISLLGCCGRCASAGCCGRCAPGGCCGWCSSAGCCGWCSSAGCCDRCSSAFCCGRCSSAGCCDRCSSADCCGRCSSADCCGRCSSAGCCGRCSSAGCCDRCAPGGCCGRCSSAGCCGRCSSAGCCDRCAPGGCCGRCSSAGCCGRCAPVGCCGRCAPVCRCGRCAPAAVGRSTEDEEAE